MILLRHLRVRALKQLREVDIWLPRLGAVLVEGQNEAGKSTLFEAVYFALYGAALVGERTAATLDDLIPHGGAEASVELWLHAGETELEIRRELSARQGRRTTHHARLTLRRPGALTEEINGPAAVNARIEQELGGLNGDALRNSCFMEQKGLDRVESLKRDQREDAVARLLGLERLGRIEDELHEAAGKEEQRLARLRNMLIVAESRHAAVAASERANIASARLQAAEVRALVAERDHSVSQRETQQQGNAQLEERRIALQAELTQAKIADRLLAALPASGEHVTSARASLASRDAHAAALAELERIERGDIPKLSVQIAALNEASAAIAEIEREEARQQKMTDAAEHYAALAQAEQQLAAAETTLHAAQRQTAQARARETLSQWIRLRELVATQDTALSETEMLRAAADERRCAQTTAQTRATRAALVALVLTMLTLLAAGVGLALHLLWIAAALLLLAAIAAHLWYRRLHRAAQVARQLADESERRRLSAEARSEAAGQFAATVPTELARLEAMLQDDNIPFPASIAAAQTALATLTATSKPSADSVERERAAHQATDEQRAAVAALRQGVQPVTDASREAAQLREQSASLQAAIEQKRAEIIARLAPLGVAPELVAVAAARGALEARLTQLNARVSERAVFEAQMQAAEASAAEQLAHAQEKLRELWRAGHDANLVTGPQPMADTSIEAVEASREALYEALSAAALRLDTRTIQHELSMIDGESGGLVERATSAAEHYATLLARIRASLASHAISCTGDEPLATLAALWPALADDTPQDVELLRTEAEWAQSDAYHHTRRTDELTAEYHLEGITLDLEQCRGEVAEAERSARHHRLAEELAREVRGRIVRRVLPETAIYMRALLPELTSGRYRDVRLLTDEAAAQGADIRLSVWDQLAGRYVAKNLFSGGTRDQCSLALRLAFALATLPKELGAMPGFIFLDEPLSSFDAERSRALIEVLTRGTIAQHFAQVVLISHSQSFEREHFHYHLRMAGGRIVESNLPDEREATELWQMESAMTQAQAIEIAE